MEFLFDNRSSDSPLVETIWHTVSNAAGTFISQAVSNWEMVIWRYEGETQITVRGPETVASIVDSPADAEFFGISFRVGSYLSHLPARQLVNSNIILPKASKKSFWLHGAVWELPTYDNADIFVKRLMREDLLICDPVVEAVIQNRSLDISPRSLQYHFLQTTGLTQSTFRQIQRAREAAELLKRGDSILDTTYQTGYYDQAHLTRSLKRYMGQTPTQIALVSGLM